MKRNQPEQRLYGSMVGGPATESSLLDEHASKEAHNRSYDGIDKEATVKQSKLSIKQMMELKRRKAAGETIDDKDCVIF
jgi:hypothetical protein